MAKYCIDIGLYASMQLHIEANSSDEAEQKAIAEMYDEDKFIDANRDAIVICSPVIEEIWKEDE